MLLTKGRYKQSNEKVLKRIGIVLGSLVGVLLLAGVVLYFTPLARILLAAGMLGQLPAESVNHEIHVTAPEQGVTVEYSKYLVDTNDCRVCQGPDLNGGPFPDPTITKISPNLTPGGEVSFWSEEDFINTIRTGRTPSGHQLNPDFMPWGLYRLFYDDELKARYMYLQSLPKLSQYME